LKEFNFREFAYNTALQESDDVETIVCPETELELYFVAGSERIYIIDSFGECRDCQGHFHVSAMHGLTKYEWPIQYDGALCKKCFYNDDPAFKLTAEEKQSLRDSED
jgi:hypothetical protein